MNPKIWLALSICVCIKHISHINMMRAQQAKMHTPGKNNTIFHVMCVMHTHHSVVRVASNKIEFHCLLKNYLVVNVNNP